MHYTQNWKHTTKNHKAYGNWDGTKYNTPFMTISESDIQDEDGDEE